MLAQTVTSSPVTAAVVNQVCASQTPYAGQLVLNGAGASFSINNIATAQDPAGAGNLTLVSSPVSFPSARYIYITSAANDTALTFTVTGLGASGAPLTERITGANAKARVSTNQFLVVTQIAVSGNSGSVQVGSFTGATFTGATARQVTVVMAGDESTKSFVITGTDANGNPQTETVAGLNTGTATTVGYFKTVTSVTISANAAGALTVGMTNTGSTPWVRFDDFAPSNISVQCSVSGSVTYTVQSTLDDPNSAMSPVAASAVTWVSSSDANVVGATATKQSNFLFAPKFARVLITTTSTGTVRATFLQSSAVPL